MDFLSELKWRGLFFDMTTGTDKFLGENFTSGYIGFDPSAPSLGIGNLVQVMILRFFQMAGHRPVAVLGGATGMIGDPSGKSAERNLLTRETLNNNKENSRAWLALNMMNEARTGFRAFNEGTKETGREIDFVKLRQGLAKGVPWTEELIESLMPGGRD